MTKFNEDKNHCFFLKVTILCKMDCGAHANLGTDKGKTQFLDPGTVTVGII